MSAMTEHHIVTSGRLSGGIKTRENVDCEMGQGRGSITRLCASLAAVDRPAPRFDNETVANGAAGAAPLVF